MWKISECFVAKKIKAERIQNRTSNKSRWDREKKRHLCRPIAPGLQHVVWRLSNSNRSTLDYLESFERQPGQLWVCALTCCMILRLPCVSIKPNVSFPAVLSLPFPPSFSFILSSPIKLFSGARRGILHSWTKLWWISQAMCFPSFLEITTWICTFSWQSRGRRARHCLCS